jgi:hypothetical protein
MSDEPVVKATKKKTTKDKVPKPKAEPKAEAKKDEEPKEPKERGPSLKDKVDKFWKDVVNIDHDTATRFILVGLVVAVVFGIAGLTSRSLAANAVQWTTIQNQQALLDFWSGKIDYHEYDVITAYIIKSSNQMVLQQAIFGNVCRLGVDVSLIFVMIGFLAYANSDRLNDKMKLLSLIIGGVIVTVLLFTTLFTNIAVNIA